MECFVIFRRPGVGFGFGGEFALLIGQVRTDEVRLDKGLEHTRLHWPFQVVCCHN